MDTPDVEDAVPFDPEQFVDIYADDIHDVDAVFIDPPSIDDRAIDKWLSTDPRAKTKHGLLVLCLNIGTAPPDSDRNSLTAKQECWIDPNPANINRSMKEIGDALESQYRHWLDAKYVVARDPKPLSILRCAEDLRADAHADRVLFHYNGHGVPAPTGNGEIWFFSEDFREYHPVSIYDLKQRIGTPAMYVFDCPSAGGLIAHLRPDPVAAAGPGPSGGSSGGGSGGGGVTVLCACDAGEVLPSSPELPADLFTACLTTPLKVALRWLVLRDPSGTHTDLLPLLDLIPGALNLRTTPLGELRWILTTVTDTIGWCIHSIRSFQRNFRQDQLQAALFRNFILAERVMKEAGCSPVAYPPVPASAAHPMWAAWDLAAEMALTALAPLLRGSVAGADADARRVGMRAVERIGLATRDRVARVQHAMRAGPPRAVSAAATPSAASSSRGGSGGGHTNFFVSQLRAFDAWLQVPATDGTVPEQLAVLLQALLAPPFRGPALTLLARFADLGPDAVFHILSIGVTNYLYKLLSLESSLLKGRLVFLWAKIIAHDPSTRQLLAPARDTAPTAHIVSHLSEDVPPLEIVSALSVCAHLLYPTPVAPAIATTILPPIQNLLDPDGPPEVLQWACLALAAAARSAYRVRCAAWLERVPDGPRALLRHPSPLVRAAAVHAVAALVGVGDSHAQGALATMRRDRKGSAHSGRRHSAASNAAASSSASLGAPPHAAAAVAAAASVSSHAVRSAESSEAWTLSSAGTEHFPSPSLSGASTAPSQPGHPPQPQRPQGPLGGTLLDLLLVGAALAVADDASPLVRREVLCMLGTLSLDPRHVRALLLTAVTVADVARAASRRTTAPSDAPASPSRRQGRSSRASRSSESDILEMTRTRLEPILERRARPYVSVWAYVRRAADSEPFPKLATMAHNIANRVRSRYLELGVAPAPRLRTVAPPAAIGGTPIQTRTRSRAVPASPVRVREAPAPSGHEGPTATGDIATPQTPAPFSQQLRLQPPLSYGDGSTRGVAPSPMHGSLRAYAPSTDPQCSQALRLWSRGSGEAPFVTTTDAAADRQRAAVDISTRPPARVASDIAGGAGALRPLPSPTRLSSIGASRGKEGSLLERARGQRGLRRAVSQAVFPSAGGSSASMAASASSSAAINASTAASATTGATASAAAFGSGPFGQRATATTPAPSVSSSGPSGAGTESDGYESGPEAGAVVPSAQEFDAAAATLARAAEAAGFESPLLALATASLRKPLLTVTDEACDALTPTGARRAGSLLAASQALRASAHREPGSRLDQQVLIENSGAEFTQLIAFHPYAPCLVVARDGDGLNLWDVDANRLVTSMQNGTSKRRTTSLGWAGAHSQSTLLVGADDGTLRAWRGTDEFLATPTLRSAFRAAPDMTAGFGPGLVSSWDESTGMLYAAGSTPRLWAWDLTTERHVTVVPSGTGAGWAHCVSAIPGTPLALAGYGEGTVRLFDVRLHPRDACVAAPREDSDWVLSVAAQSGSARAVVSASSDGVVRVWDVRRMAASVQQLRAAPRDTNIIAFDLHPRTDLMGAGTEQRSVHARQLDGRDVGSMRYHEGFFSPRLGRLSCVAFHPTRLLLAAGSVSDCVVSVYSAEAP